MEVDTNKSRSSKVRNALWSAAFVLLLMVPLSLCAAVNAGLPLPSWLTSEDASYLEGRKPIVALPALGGTEGFQSGTAQTVIQDYLAAFFPMRASVLLGNAELQRDAIALSNQLFGWDCYPTYYGSSVLYVPSMNRLSAYPVKKSGNTTNESNQEKYSGFFEGLRKVAVQFPSTNFYIYIADTSDESEFNVANSLVSFPEDLDDIAACFEDELGDLENVFVEYDDFVSVEDCYSRRYRSDMHWNWYGALQAYNELAAISNMQEYPNDVGSVHIADFYGGSARSGRMLIESSGDDCDLGFADLNIVMKSGEMDNGDKHLEYYSADEKMQSMNWYETYYGSYGSSPEILGVGEGNALVITDSYGAGIKRYIAKQYETTFIKWNLAGKEYSETLAELIKGNDINDVYFIGVQSNFALYENGKEDFFN